jgi:sugar lactone lactonase YvrE
MTDNLLQALDHVLCDLGESAVWDDRRGRLHWVDITTGRVHTRDWASGVVSTLVLGDMVGSVGLRAGGGLVAALRHALAYVDVDAGTVETLGEVEADLAGNRCNDGAVDPAGRFWFGTMDLAETDPTGSFYCLRPDGTVTAAFGGIVCSNGPAWSPDGRTLYHVDSTRQRVRAYPFDPATGEVGEGRVFADDTGTGWYPDGVTVDAAGYVWNCKWAGSKIVRYAPDGAVDREIHLPVPRPTRCAFVGPDLSVLAVTTARIGMSEAELAAAPLSGQVLIVDPGGARGLPTPRFAG